jgi:hypothetical protein
MICQGNTLTIIGGHCYIAQACIKHNFRFENHAVSDSLGKNEVQTQQLFMMHVHIE